jgi:hypothetical protein
MFGLITDGDTKSNRSKDPHKESVTSAREREKKTKYLGACLEQRQHFSPFVVSVLMVSSAKKRRSCERNYLSGSPRSGRNAAPKVADVSMPV